MTALHIAIGHDDAIDVADIIERLFAQTRDAPSEARHRAAILFASVGYDHRPVLRAIAARWPGVTVVGCTGNGTLTPAGYMTDGVALAVLSSDVVAFRAVSATGLVATPEIVPSVATGLLEGGERPACVFAFADGLSGDLETALARLHGGFGPSPPPIFGGLAGDDWRLERTFQFHDDRVLTDSMVALGLYGDVTVAAGVGIGWTPVGDPMIVTASQGARLETINGRRTTDVLRDHLRELWQEGLTENPLALFPDPTNTEDYYLRALMRADVTAGAIDTCGLIPAGTTVRFTTATRDRILKSTARATADALDALDGPPSGLLVVSCAARQSVLGRASARERDAIAAVLAERGLGALPYLGFYSYGEFGTAARFHNETCVTIAISARGAG